MHDLIRTRYQAGFFVVLVALIIITPFCGWLFDCGCTWPWAGLESHCNIHNPDVQHQCPWCASTFAGVVSVGLAVLMGFLLAIRPLKSGYDMRGSALAGRQQTSAILGFIKRVSMGLTAFAVTAVITAWLSAYAQDYPGIVLNKWLIFFIVN